MTHYLELHLLQNFAPSNLNRDDTGSPKDCEFGGARRARISSQCLKRAMRQTPAFATATGVEPALRTKRVKQQIAARLPDEVTMDEQAEAVLDEVVKALLSKLDKDGQRTAIKPPQQGDGDGQFERDSDRWGGANGRWRRHRCGRSTSRDSAADDHHQHHHAPQREKAAPAQC